MLKIMEIYYSMYYKKLIKVLTKRKRSSSEYVSLIVMSIFQWLRKTFPQLKPRLEHSALLITVVPLYLQIQLSTIYHGQKVTLNFAE